jgi:hypothetical protein
MIVGIVRQRITESVFIKWDDINPAVLKNMARSLALITR